VAVTRIATPHAPRDREHVGAAPAEQREEEHQRDDAQVLEEEDRDDHAAVRRVELTPVGVDLEDDGGGREGDERPEERPLAPVLAERQDDGGDGEHGPHQLQCAAHHHQPPHLHDPGERELEPDGEEQEHDADLGQRLDRLHLAHQPQGGGADRDAAHQEADHAGNAQPVGENDHGNRDRHQDDEVAQEGDAVHARKLSRRRRVCRDEGANQGSGASTLHGDKRGAARR
jgi:hypothetical protein